MFKKGQSIKCLVTDPQKRVYAGVVYTVREIFGEWMNLVHTDYPYHVSRFEKVNEMNPDKIEINGKAKPKTKGNPPANTFFVRRVGGVSPKVMYTTFDDARNEANRLAELTPNTEYQVMAIAYSVKKVPVYTTEAQEYTL